MTQPRLCLSLLKDTHREGPAKLYLSCICRQDGRLARSRFKMSVASVSKMNPQRA